MPLKLYQRSKFAQIAFASTGVPSVNLAPSRRWKVQFWLSELSQLVARAGTTSVVPGWSVTRVSKISAMTRSDSPSLTYAPSMLTGSEAVPKVSTSAPPPPPPPPFPPLLPLHADKAIRVAAANGATHVTLRRADIASPIPNDGPARTGEPHHNARPQ